MLRIDSEVRGTRMAPSRSNAQASKRFQICFCMKLHANKGRTSDLFVLSSRVFYRKPLDLVQWSSWVFTTQERKKERKKEKRGGESSNVCWAYIFLSVFPSRCGLAQAVFPSRCGLAEVTVRAYTKLQFEGMGRATSCFKFLLSLPDFDLFSQVSMKTWVLWPPTFLETENPGMRNRSL